MPTDSPEYLAKKQFFARLLTIYGRKPVLEALQEDSVKPYKLHLAESNKGGGIMAEIMDCAADKGVPVEHHSREALARISKNKKQDQGVALDIECRGFADAQSLLDKLPPKLHLIAVNNVTNPQNLGMIVRSVCASPSTGLLLPEKGCAKLDSLVIKASAGTLFRAPVFRCGDLAHTLKQFSEAGCEIYGLAASAKQSLTDFTPAERSIYVLGNETHGLSPEVQAACTSAVRIPMNNQVESLNVSITASLIAFRPLF